VSIIRNYLINNVVVISQSPIFLTELWQKWEKENSASLILIPRPTF